NCLRSLAEDNVEEVRDIPTLLSELGRAEKVGRQSAAGVAHALNVIAAAVQDWQVEIEPALIWRTRGFWLSAQKVAIVLAHEEVRAIDRVGIGTTGDCERLPCRVRRVTTRMRQLPQSTAAQI